MISAERPGGAVESPSAPPGDAVKDFAIGKTEVSRKRE